VIGLVRTPAALLSAVLTSACGVSADGDRIDVVSLEQSLLDARAATTPRWDAVGAPYAPELPELGSCTGTLVGPAAVLTAKHCVLLGASMPEARFVFAIGPDAFSPKAMYPISGWDWETGVEPVTESTYGQFGSDVGIVRLGAEVARVLPLEIGRLHRADRGRRFAIVGYGVSSDAGDTGRRRVGRMTFRGIGGNYADYAFGSLDGFVAAAATLPGFHGLERRRCAMPIVASSSSRVTKRCSVASREMPRRARVIRARPSSPRMAGTRLSWPWPARATSLLPSTSVILARWRQCSVLRRSPSCARHWVSRPSAELGSSHRSDALCSCWVGSEERRT
jgi:hypothetical protein